MRTWVKVVVAVVAAILLLAVSSKFLGQLRQDATEDEELRGDRTVRFVVRVPDATPREDAIVLHVGPALHPMTPLGDGRHEVNVTFRAGDAGRSPYGYSRGGFEPFGEAGLLTASEQPRALVVSEASAVEDVVTDWKWFPESPANETPIASWAGNATPAPRPEFWFGPHIADFWNPTFKLQFNATAAHMEQVGYSWVALSPPWDLKSADPPVFSNENVSVPAWSDADLREEIRFFKAHGFKVLMRAQTCCVVPDLANRSDDWWRAYYAEYRAFVQHHADIAREEDVDAFVFASGAFALPGAEHAPAFASEEWARVVDAAKTSGAPVSYDFYALPSKHGVGEPWPWSNVDFVDRLDFLAVNFGPPLSDLDDPTQEDLDRNMSREWEGVDRAHDETGLPVVLHGTHWESLVGGAKEKPPEHYDAWGDPANATYRYDGRIQAMCFESLMRAVAQRPWVQGVLAWGYPYVDAPLTPDGSIRAKPAEDVLAAWATAIRDART